MKNFNLQPLGGGIGLRHEHLDDIIADSPAFRWFEIIAEDFIGMGGRVGEKFEEIRRRYPVICHGVGMSIGSTDPLDREYLAELKRLIERIDSPWFSDHLCFTMVDHTNLENLIPLPFTSEAVNNIASRVKAVQDAIGRPFLLENVTRYVTVSDREMPEVEFINRILDEAGCGLLLDVTNVCLNAKYHGYNPFKFIDALPLERVGQMHLAGWTIEKDGSFIDSHDAAVPDEVWNLFRYVIERTGMSSVVIERDKYLPSVSELLSEAGKADTIMRQISGTLKAA